MPYNKQYLMLSVLRFGVKKYNVCDYKIGNFIKIAFQYISHNAGPLVEPLKPLKTLIWLQPFKTFNLAEKPLITFILINKPLNFARSV